jgi:hypothetical protein
MRRWMPLLMLCAGAQAQNAAPTFAEQAKRFEEVISGMAKVDQKHPDFLNANLDYVLLLTRAAEGDCRERLISAQSMYDTVRNTSVAPLVLAAAAGRIPFAGYSIEMARYRCLADPDQKHEALVAAQKLARDAVEGYRTAFYYDSMAVMQYNVAQSYVDLGDKAQAIKELETAIAIDRTYGLRRDAEENFRVLKEWQGAKTSDAEIATFVESLKPETATLAFDWKPFSVQANAQFDFGSFEGVDVKHTRFAVPMTGKLKNEKDHLVYEWTTGEPHIETAFGTDAAGRVERKIVAVLARLVGRLPPAEISRAGEFKGVREVDVLSKSMTKEIDDAVAATVPADDARLPQIKAVVDEALRPYAKPENLLGKFQEQFALDTGIWIGAKLEHGTWMEMPLIMSLNGTPQGFVRQRARFALTRWLPCEAKSAPRSCIEVVLEARPEQPAVADIAAKMAAANQGRFDYVGETRRRIVIDPATLRVYESESMRLSYIAVTKDKHRAVKIGADHNLVTSHYSK